MKEDVNDNSVLEEEPTSSKSDQRFGDQNAPHIRRIDGECKFGDRCLNSECAWMHTQSSSIKKNCPKGDACSLYFKDRAHRFKLKHPIYKMRCVHNVCTNMRCTFVHGEPRPPMCNHPHSCFEFAHGLMVARHDGGYARCPRLHSYDFRACKYGTKCRMQDCENVHPPECPDGYDCPRKNARRMCSNVKSCQSSACRAACWHIGDSQEDLACCFAHYRPSWKKRDDEYIDHQNYDENRTRF